MRSTDSEPQTTPEDSRRAGEPSVPQKSTERAFVIQFDPVESERTRLRGWVEVVASGEHVRFRSLKALVAFMVGILRRRAGPES